MGKKLRGVVVLLDHIPGHSNQSLGVSLWLENLGGMSGMAFTVPSLGGGTRLWSHKVTTLALRSSRAFWGRWLSLARGNSLLLEIMKQLVEKGIPYDRALFLSAGSGAAPYTLAMARAIGARCCTIMTPSVLGVVPFDYALVPEHDDPPEDPRILPILGAPNTLVRENLAEPARQLLSFYPSTSSRRWVFLIGGDDKNYSLSPSWVRKVLDPLVDRGIERGAEIYLTTSRRTSSETEALLRKILHHRPKVRMYLPASEQTFSPVAGMLGLATRVFCTEDSVSMVSEAITAGHRVHLLRGEPRNSTIRGFQKKTEALWKKRLLPGSALWGAPRFDRLFRSFEARGFLLEQEDFQKKLDFPDEPFPSVPEDFNEARRGARWLLEQIESSNRNRYGQGRL